MEGLQVRDTWPIPSFSCCTRISHDRPGQDLNLSLGNPQNLQNHASSIFLETPLPESLDYLESPQAPVREGNDQTSIQVTF